MALGLGQMLGMGLLSQFFGGEDKEGLLQQQQNQQPPTQVANSGFNMNNMTPGQWANTAIALNSMRLEPDANLATAMRERITSDQSRVKGVETAKWLDGMVSEQYPDGRADLSAMVRAGILDPQTALQMAMKKTELPEWRQKYDFVMKKLADGEELSDIEKALFGIPQKPTNTTLEKLKLLMYPPKEIMGEDGWTEQQLEVVFGIKPDNALVFQAKLDKVDSLIASDPDMFTDEEVQAMYMKILSGGGTDIDIDIEGDEAPELDAGNYASAATQDLYLDHKTIIDGLPKLIQQIQKIHEMQDILDRADEGEIRTGVFEPMQSMVSRIAAGLGLGDGDQAISMQILQSYMGGDVFPLIRALGIGARGMDTPEERKFLQASFVGETTMEVGALKAITERRLAILMEALEIYNSRASALTEDGNNSAYFKMYEDTFKVRIMPRQAPQRKNVIIENQNIVMDKYF